MSARKLSDEFLTVRQVAKRLKVPAKTIDAEIAAGRLRSVRIGAGRGAIRIRESHLADYLRDCEVKAAPPKRESKKPPPFVSSGGVELIVNADGSVTRRPFGNFRQRPMTPDEFAPWFDMLDARVKAARESQGGDDAESGG